MKNGLLETIYQIRSGEEEAYALDRLRQKGQREGGAGEEDQREPEELVDDLGFLHGVGDAGDDQTQGAEGDDSDGH